jgi:hypothetical protein
MIYHRSTLKAESENRGTGFTGRSGMSYVLPDPSIRSYDSQNSVRLFDLLTGFSPGANWITLPISARKEAYVVRTR